MAKKIKMLRPGTFTAMSGKTHSFSEADLRATAAAYDPTVFAAPIVKGHPEHDAPAYGRIYAVEFSEGHLVGTPGKVDPAFTEEVNAGRFDNVSLSLYPPDHPANPVPGVFYPRHLGFLGAMPPAVKGMGQVSLSEDEEGIISFAEMDMKESPKKAKEKTSMDMKKRAQHCADCSDQCCMDCCPEDAISMTKDKGAIIDPAKCTCCMECCDACCMMQGPAMGMQVANYAERERTAQKSGNAAFAEGLVKQGKILPAQKAQVAKVLDFLSDLTGGNKIEFGEGMERKSRGALDAFKELLSVQPKKIEFGEYDFSEEPVRKEASIPADISKYV